MSRSTAIRELLEEAFSPELLEIIDDSHLHAGHAGTTEHGGGHFRIRIKAACFKGLSRLEAHRAANRALQPLFPATIHAAGIEIVTT